MIPERFYLYTETITDWYGRVNERKRVVKLMTLEEAEERHVRQCMGGFLERRKFRRENKDKVFLDYMAITLTLSREEFEATCKPISQEEAIEYDEEWRLPPRKK